MGSTSQSVSLLDTSFKMEMTKAILKHTYRCFRALSRDHKIVKIAVVVAFLFFISLDNMKLDKNFERLSIYFWLLGFFCIFSTTFNGNRIKPNYSNFSKWYNGWLLVAALYHFPSVQSMGMDIRMNLSLFLTIFILSILFLLAFHVIFLGMSYIRLLAPEARKLPEILTIIQNCAATSVACCVHYSHYGDYAISEGTPSGWKEENNTLLTKLMCMNEELKDRVCSSRFAPLGSASDYRVLSWVIYGKLDHNVSYQRISDTISPVYSLWLRIMGLYMGIYIANYAVARIERWVFTDDPLPVDQENKEGKEEPDFLDMVPWYSGTSADLYKTAFNLMVSVTIFLGRFDMRMMQAVMSRVHEGAKEDDLLFRHFSGRSELWFDFMADTGDGGNSTYTVARLLAQPEIHIPAEDSKPKRTLSRGDLLLIGGDLAYPYPSEISYEKRFFRPFEDALQPPRCYKLKHIAVNKPEVPFAEPGLMPYGGPQCFAIPGNHDWFDGLQTFMRHICHRSWLGGWLLPQKRSYFALKLPRGWWVFGFDQALHVDIDVYQFKFFEELARTEVGKNDSVIIMTHEPNWLLDWYGNDISGKNVSHLIRDHLKGRCKLRMAGDLHHYMRHSVSSATPDNLVDVRHLLVNGCGGAFLHPTHTFCNFKKLNETSYEFEKAYPTFGESGKIPLGNILGFRKSNLGFDIIGGIIYFILVFSMFPQCKLGHILHDGWISGHFLKSFFSRVWSAFEFMLNKSYVSFIGTLFLLVAAYCFVPSKVPWKSRAIIGILHVSAHMTAVLILMLLMELGVEMCINRKLVSSSGYHTLYKWFLSERKHVPGPASFLAFINQWTFGLCSACIKYIMFAFDVPEIMAVTRTRICNKEMESSRGDFVLYYSSVFLYFWFFSTRVVSLVFGSYLYICVHWFNLHFDEAFSSLRNANYKGFTRFHITHDGDLEVFSLAVDEVPKKWKQDSKWQEEEKKLLRRYHRKHPSKWTAAAALQDPLATVRIVDHFEIKKTDPQNTAPSPPTPPPPPAPAPLPPRFSCSWCTCQGLDFRRHRYRCMGERAE